MKKNDRHFQNSNFFVEFFEVFGSQNGAKRALETNFICLQLNI